MVDISGVTVTEKITSRSTNLSRDPSVELIYNAHGTEDDIKVTTAIAQKAPAVYRGLKRSSIDVKPVDYNVWEATVTYSLDEDERFQTDISWSTTGKTQKIFRSYKTESILDFDRNPWQDAPVFDRLINCTPEGVEGVEITLPVLNFTESHKYKPSQVTSDLIQKLSQNTGSINNANFRNFTPGEVLFKGISGNTSNDLVTISFEFAVAESWTWVHNGEAHIIQGWNYLWYFNIPQMDLRTGYTVQVPMAAYEEQVYPYSTFKDFVPSLVGIPDNPLPGNQETEEAVPVPAPAPPTQPPTGDIA